jgi:murein DD-endopeptidase MepM/ murein hydrolase activator NlpD
MPQDWPDEPAVDEPIVGPAAWAAAVQPIGRPAEVKPAAAPKRGRPLLRSLRHRAAIAVAVCLVVVVAVGVMPQALGGQSAPVTDADADANADVGGEPLQPVGTYLVPPVTPTPERWTVPIAGSPFGWYEVKAGDNLTRIANSFDLSTTTLYWANNDTVSNPDLVKIGQKLLIPPMDGVVTRAGQSDTVEAIAVKYGIDPQVIIDANSMTSTDLTDGQLLILPGVPNKAMPRPAPRGPETWRNKLAWPVPSSHRLTLLFGCTNYALELPFGNCRHWHSGLDIGAAWGKPVVAAAAGTVIYAGRRQAGSDGAGGGIVVWISHGGTLYTTYNHLAGVTVRAGQRVAAGDQVGTVGATGAADGSHLHFEVWTDYPWTGGDVAYAVDPLLYTTWKPGS